jgi:hypothetical protein
MIGSVGKFSSVLGRRPPAFSRPASISIAYIDTDSAKIELALAKHRSALNLAGKTSRKTMRQALDEHFESLGIPDLMTKTKERLDAQVRSLKERLEARLEAMGADASETTEDSSVEHGRRLAGFAISLFNGFLERSAKFEPEMGQTDHRREFSDMMKEAMKKGFEQARTVYAGMEKLDPDQAKQLQTSFDEAQSRLDQFAERLG